MALPDRAAGSDMTDGGSPPSLVAARAVTVRIGPHELLSRVDVAVGRGEIVSLIGPNGAGKTTLLRALLGVLEPTEGAIWRAQGLVVGYVPQRFHLDPVLPLTVERFLTVRLAPPRGALDAALAEVGAAQLRRAPMHELSGGEFQRALLARALLRRPDLLMLDEPGQGLDFSGQLELYRLIEQIRDRHGCGVLLVSHDLHIVMAATDRVVCLNRHVCCSGLPEAVSRHPEYMALFGPGAAAGLAVYAHAHDHAHDLAGEVVPQDTPAATVAEDAPPAEGARHAG
ncbi:MAG TPA: zinc ABC transporter ATP-binding protein ZnuC [Geminicoccaceae bacterium]|nr:zinc ABC transporter ATP-binding protein ZnuC [Geminicoccaceae bacterium]